MVKKLLLSEAEDIVSSNKNRILRVCGVEAKKNAGISAGKILPGVFAAATLILFAVICYIPVIYKNNGFIPPEHTETEIREDTVIHDDAPETVMKGSLCISDGLAEYIPDNAALPQYAENGIKDAEIVTQAYTVLTEKYPELINYPRYMMTVSLKYSADVAKEKPDIVFDFNVGGVKTGTGYTYRRDGKTEKNTSVFDGLYDIYLTEDRYRAVTNQLLHDLALKLRVKPEDLRYNDGVIYSWKEKDGKVCLTVSYVKETADGNMEYSESEPVYDAANLKELKKTAKTAERKKLTVSILDDHYDNKYEEYDSVSEAVKELYCTAYGLCMNDDVLLYKTQSGFANGSLRRFLTEDRDAQHIYLNGIIYNSPKNKKSETSINDIFIRLIYSCLENSYIYTQCPSSPERDMVYPDYLSISFEKSQGKGETIVISVMHGSITDVSQYLYENDPPLKVNFSDIMKKEAERRYGENK